MTDFVSNLLSVGVQVAVLFVLIGIGAVTRWTKTLDDGSVRGCTALLLYFVTPCLLVDAFQRPCGPDQLREIGLAFLAGFFFHFVSIALARLLIHDADASRTAVLRFAIVFTNAGFMSLPLQKELLGEDGVFCGAVIVGVFQILCWTYGIWLMGQDGTRFSWRKIALNPGIVGIVVAMALFLCRIELPEVVRKPCHLMGEFNTPLAMVVIGYHLAGSRLSGVLRDGKALFAVALRLLVSPLLFVAALAALGLGDRTLVVATVIAAAAPVAAITTMFAVQFKRDVSLSVELVSLSTLLSIATMPFAVALAETFALAG